MKPRRFDFSASEWLEGTLELSDSDKGILITICALIWARGGRITIGLLKDSSKSHGNAVLASLDRLEKAGKITRNGQEIGQKRAEEELEHAQKRVEKASENASKRWNNKGIADADAFGSGNAYLHLQPSTINHQPSLPDGKDVHVQKPPSSREIAEQMVEIWNSVSAPTLARVMQLSQQRIVAANARFQHEFHKDMAEWTQLLQRVIASSFLTGDNRDGWKADFDFCLRPQKILYIREGKYDRSQPGDFDFNGHNGRTRKSRPSSIVAAVNSIH